MNEEIKISVIIPLYNAENVIDRCIKSLVNQSYKNIEIILINDGSKDNSLEVCKKIASADSRIKLISQNNSGVGIARNRGIEEASGELICFVDADDYVDKNYIEVLYKNMKQTNSELSICGYREVKESTILQETQGSLVQLDQRMAMLELLKENSFRGYVWNKMFRADILKTHQIKFDEDIVVWEDVLFVFNYLLKCQNIVFDPNPIYSYVFMENSASHLDNHVIGVEKSYDAILAKDKITCILPEDYTEVKKMLSVRYLKSALATLRNIGYASDNNEIIKMRCLDVLRKHKKAGFENLSCKEKMLVIIFLFLPDMLLALYKIRRNK